MNVKHIYYYTQKDYMKILTEISDAWQWSLPNKLNSVINCINPSTLLIQELK